MAQLVKLAASDGQVDNTDVPQRHDDIACTTAGRMRRQTYISTNRQKQTLLNRGKGDEDSAGDGYVTRMMQAHATLTQTCWWHAHGDSKTTSQGAGQKRTKLGCLCARATKQAQRTPGGENAHTLRAPIGSIR